MMRDIGTKSSEVIANENSNRRICKVDRSINSGNKGMGEEGYDPSDPIAVRSAIIQRAELERSSRPEIDISERYGYIYLTENLINGKLYIGKHKFVNRDGLDSNYYGSGVILYKAIIKYGRRRFKCSLIEYCKSESEINERERYWIREFNATESEIFYNIAEVGEGFPWEGKSEKEVEIIKRKISSTLKIYYSTNDVVNKGIPLSDKAKKNLSEKLSGKNNPNYGKPRRDEVKKKISDGNRGKVRSEDVRNRIRDSLLGRKASVETRKKISESLSGEKNPFYGKHHKKESIDLIKRNMPDMSGENNAFYGKRHTDDIRKLCSEVNKGRKMSADVMRFRNIPIKCVETGDVYKSANYLTECLFGLGHRNKRLEISRKLKDSAKFMYENGEYGEEVLGYHWCYTGERMV